MGVTSSSSSNSSLLLLFALLGAGAQTGGGVGAPKGLPIGLARTVASADGDGDEKRSPSMFCSALQLAINPTTGDCDL